MSYGYVTFFILKALVDYVFKTHNHNNSSNKQSYSANFDSTSDIKSVTINIVTGGVITLALRFIKSDEATAWTEIFRALTTALKQHQRVLWVVPGGSNIPTVVKVMAAISNNESAKLAIILSDERFGPPGHENSNLVQLYKAGFNPKKAIVVPVLRSMATLTTTVDLYSKAAQTAFTAADNVIIQLGMGADGHVAGILPSSPAAVETKKWVISYTSEPFTRITLSPFALKQAQQGFIVAFGKVKQPALVNLRDKKLPIKKQPAQLVKKIPKAYIINDQIGVAK